MTEKIILGTHLPHSIHEQEPRLLCHQADLMRHLDQPWFRAYLAHQVGVSCSPPRPKHDAHAAVSDAALARHTLLCGATGSGKSRLIEHLLVEQLKQGCSAVVLDPKPDMIAHMLAHAHSLGLASEQVTLLCPQETVYIPGWNPFLAGIPIPQAAADFVAVLEQSTTSWGPRMQDLLTNALLVIGSHHLSLYELARFLLRDDYRDALLRQPLRPPDWMAFEEARTYFMEEYGAWSRSERAQASGPVLNKIRELLRSPFLQPLLCARRNTLDLARLWQRQGLVLVHLDRTALGEEGTRLLAGMLSNLLFRTALRTAGPVPVVLSLDELATVEHFIGQALGDIVTVARSQSLRLVVACQHLAQLSEGLRAALLANPAVKVFFRLGSADARLVAAALAVGTEPRLKRLSIEVEWEDRRYGQVARAEWRHPIRDVSGQPLRLDTTAWQRLCARSDFPTDPARALRALAAQLGVPRLYVLSADSQEPIELVQYVRDLTATEYRIEGPIPLTLTMTFPRPRFQRVERWSEREVTSHWTRVLQELPVQQAVVRITEPEAARGTQTGVVRVVDVPAPTPASAHQPYRRLVQQANGQSAEEIAATLCFRQEQIERVSTGRALNDQSTGEERKDDGSLE
jgi:hypothetical protein